MENKMDGVKISVNKDGKVEKPAKKRGRPKKAIKKAPVKASVAEARTSSRTAKKSIEKSKSSKRGGFMSMLIAVVATGILVGGGIYAWQSRSGEKSINDVRQDARQVRMDFEQRLTQLKNKLTGVETENQKLKDSTKELEERMKLLDGAKKDFSDPEIGVAFEYPAIFGDVEMEMIDGAVGKKFEASFTENKSLIFGGASVDFAPKASTTKVDFLESLGYYSKKGQFYFQSIAMEESMDYEIVPTKQVGEDDRVLIINQKSFVIAEDAEVSSVDIGESIGAIMNLELENFKGISFINQDLAVMPMESFENMLFSIEIKK